MAKVDNLLERRAKQVVLAIVARLAHRSPPTANLVVEGITDRPNRESQTARKPHARPAFLQNRLLAQVKSSRPINRFLILHRRPTNLYKGGVPQPTESRRWPPASANKKKLGRPDMFCSLLAAGSGRNYLAWR
jgi:hypothetical protein